MNLLCVYVHCVTDCVYVCMHVDVHPSYSRKQGIQIPCSFRHYLVPSGREARERRAFAGVGHGSNKLANQSQTGRQVTSLPPGFPKGSTKEISRFWKHAPGFAEHFGKFVQWPPKPLFQGSMLTVSAGALDCCTGTLATVSLALETGLPRISMAVLGPLTKLDPAKEGQYFWPSVGSINLWRALRPGPPSRQDLPKRSRANGCGSNFQSSGCGGSSLWLL